MLKKILLVEDNEMNRDMLSRRLQRNGFDVCVAEDGEQGIAMVSSEQPDIVLMDMSLPIVDGWEATRRIRESDSGELPVIGLSAHAGASDRERALQAGCDDYDTKPVDLERLMGKINQQLGLE